MLHSQYPKIAVADLPDWVRPEKSPFPYPPYAKDIGIEQDFLDYLKFEYPSTVQDLSEADYLYIPVYWTRLHVKNAYGKYGLNELKDAVEPWLSLNVKKFTICQYDDGPLINLQDTLICLGSRKTAHGLDVPLLATPLPQPLWKRGQTERDIKASFAGRITTHHLRQALFSATEGFEDVYLSARSLRPRRYRQILQRTKIALAPRGYGGSSFRFFEALQMGAVPWLIGEEDVRPFKSQIDWASISFYSEDVDQFLDSYSELSDLEIDRKVHNVSVHSDAVWRLGAWCQLLINELSSAPLRN